MKSPYTIVKTLILSEKISRGIEKANRYCFKVAPEANKREIKRAVEQLFKVHVVQVNTMRRKGKLRRERTAGYGRTAFHKRALVTLKEGDKIEIV
ncbi:MAG: 50S ribosomal protein L23 [Lentisphaerae bacterium]|nr:50S ribosomal protein L23 [Lentisphaerota bacterium]